MDDSEIIRLYLSRDERAISETMNTYGGRLYRFACRFLADKRDAEECVNQTYAAAWSTIPPMRPDDLFAYLAALCRNTAYDIVKRDRAQKRSVTLVELTAEMSECIPDSSSLGDEECSQLSELISEYLHSIPKDKRAVFIGRYWYGESIADISRKTGLTKSNVKVTLHRMRAELKKYILQKGGAI